MRERVQCDNCGAHRDRALFRAQPWNDRCYVCGAYAAHHVPPNQADLEHLAEQLRRAADGDPA